MAHPSPQAPLPPKETLAPQETLPPLAALPPLAHLVRWLIPAASLITIAGFFGPWVDHAAAGLVIAGLDLGEYVKFLTPVRSGAIALWREGFYLPLVAAALALSLHAFRKEWAYRLAVRAALLAGATVAALNLLPPAWSPPLLLTPEFRTQTAALALLLACAMTSPLLALLPLRITAAIGAAAALAALLLPALQFRRVLPAIEALYNHTILPGWGLWVSLAGLLLLLAAQAVLLLPRRAAG